MLSFITSVLASKEAGVVTRSTAGEPIGVELGTDIVAEKRILGLKIKKKIFR
jgi:hypothetical protein